MCSLALARASPTHALGTRGAMRRRHAGARLLKRHGRLGGFEAQHAAQVDLPVELLRQAAVLRVRGAAAPPGHQALVNPVP